MTQDVVSAETRDMNFPGMFAPGLQRDTVQNHGVLSFALPVTAHRLLPFAEMCRVDGGESWTSRHAVCPQWTSPLELISHR